MWSPIKKTQSREVSLPHKSSSRFLATGLSVPWNRQMPRYHHRLRRCESRFLDLVTIRHVQHDQRAVPYTLYTAGTGCHSKNKSVFSFLRQLTTWHCPRSATACHCCSAAAAEHQPCMNRSISFARQIMLHPKGRTAWTRSSGLHDK